MKNGTVLLFPPGPDIVGQAIKDVTHGPAHVKIVVGGLVFDDTIWHQPGRLLPVSGARISFVEDAPLWGDFVARDPVVEWGPGETYRALLEAVAQVNLRRRYNIPLLIADSVIYPTRHLWEKIGWVPFEHAHDYVCSSFAALVYRASGRDPWPGKDTEELVPLDFVDCPEWRNE